MGMLTARISKQDQVNRDTVLVQPNKKGVLFAPPP